MSVSAYVAKGFIAKYWKEITVILSGLVVVAVILVLTFTQAIQSINPMNMLGNIFGGGQPIPASVMRYEEDIKEELEKYGREEHLELVLAIVTQESGGTGSPDIMQASESLGLPPNTIKEPSESIEAGVKYFDEVLSEAENKNVDVMAAVQSYNMGNGYIDYVAENGGEHSTELAQKFSNMKKAELGWNTYGDPNYVENVSRYIGVAQGSVGSITPSGTFQNPYIAHVGKYVVSSEFGYRTHPIYKTSKLHAGIDLSTHGANLPISAPENGVVTGNSFSRTGGYYVELNHTQGLKTRYLHLAQPSHLKIGEKVEKGDNIGITGTTGSSTGVHLHYEIIENGQQVNPRKYHEF